MRKSATHWKDVSRFVGTTVDSGKSKTVIPTCSRNSHLKALMHAFPLEQQRKPKFSIPHTRRSIINRLMSTSALILERSPSVLPTVTSCHSHKTTPTESPTNKLQGSLDLFGFSDRIALADLDLAIQLRNADKAWSLFSTLEEAGQVVPLSMCCSLYALLNYSKRLAGGLKQVTKQRQRQLDTLLEYVGKQENSIDLFLSSIQDIPISAHKQLLKSIRIEDQQSVWQQFYRIHKSGNAIQKFPRSTCIKLMLFMMKDRKIDKNQLKMRLQLIALHGAGISEFESRYISAADMLRIAYICQGYTTKKLSTVYELVDEFVSGTLKKKQSIRADAIDELVWRLLEYQDTTKAREILTTIQTKYADKIDVNEMVFINLMNAYRRKNQYHEALKIFEELLMEAKRKPTVKAFNAILQIFSAQGATDRAAYIFESMNQLGVIPDLATYTELIRASANQPKYSTYYYNNLLENGLQPNVYTFSALIEACSKRNDIKSALKWFETMINCQIQPNHVVISCILKSLSNQHFDHPNMPEAVLQIAHQATKAGIKSDAALYTILLKMQAESVGIEGALNLHKEMLSKSIEPNTYTYTILIQACGKDRKPETAEKIFDLMKKSKRHQPNTVTYTVLMDVWSENENQDKVESLMLEFLKQSKSDKTGKFWLDTKIRDRLTSRCC